MDKPDKTDRNKLLQSLDRIEQIATQNQISNQEHEELNNLIFEIQDLQEIPAELPDLLEDLSIEIGSWNEKQTHFRKDHL